MAHLENRLTTGGQPHHTWNKKLCFEARDTLLSCVNRQSNGNKYRCPDELYAYEMWCPTVAQRMNSVEIRQDERDA